MLYDFDIVVNTMGSLTVYSSSHASAATPTIARYSYIGLAGGLADLASAVDLYNNVIIILSKYRNIGLN